MLRMRIFSNNMHSNLTLTRTSTLNIEAHEHSERYEIMQRPYPSSLSVMDKRDQKASRVDKRDCKQWFWRS